MSLLRPYFLFAYSFWSLYFMLTAFPKCLIFNEVRLLKSFVYLEECSMGLGMGLSGWTFHSNVSIYRFLSLRMIRFFRKSPLTSWLESLSLDPCILEAVWKESLNNNIHYVLFCPLFNSVHVLQSWDTLFHPVKRKKKKKHKKLQ